MADVADRVGVSRQLVSLVMRGSPGPSSETRSRVLEAAAEIGYRTNASARLLRQKRSYLVGAMFTMRNPYESRLVEQLFVTAATRGYGVVLGPVTDETDRDRIAGELLEQRVEALVGFVPARVSPALRRILGQLPVVWLGGPSPDHDNVHIDDRAGMRQAVDHLRSLGHRRIAHLAGAESPAGDERRAAYEDVMTEVGLGAEVEVLAQGWDEETGAAVARDLVRRSGSRAPTAVICPSDQSAAALVTVLRSAGTEVPGRFSVTGWDDSYLAGLSYLDLTSVRQEIDATADATLDLVVRRLDDPSAGRATVLTAPTLVVRGSTGPARPVRRRN